MASIIFACIELQYASSAYVSLPLLPQAQKDNEVVKEKYFIQSYKVPSLPNPSYREEFRG